ncbi:helix-turn-helix transcriptional regulator [Riemerella anatipestifer]|uniref:Transcriptional regulator, luxr family n=1 Tax=Riemerella anatipestifer (strain ATCC 11845 / DSM 15868 / JCM 9532 / NCTC 11014) TaxID=693978 RepID=E4TAI9_RIEAD|nr:helix-turn-helix transcriptional regulator [Riemerella anatipestifer]ADQ82349.1 transcriptional regulator, LuxR family [Riemerella anatipestifer ATCC 11845 = DSM 15868]ADZ12155.1 transcriptional regulator, LuxR family [Riemerella anatipestifer RA-GD]AFD56352.1 transcriptional regulator, luxr family [Riemerella anatipestifer ATCC 11845 = DSM 15868]AGC39722.1 Response regulator containing a CheY-like receiver domain and an HTH DNA-binding domain [Riemerella anatipestifer RA-CH-2]AKP69550.1 tr
MEDINGFFDDRNTFHHLSDNDLEQLKDYISVVDAFARLSYKSIYVIDYQNQSFEYVSNNPLFLCGLSSQEVKELGYAFYFRNVKKEDLELLMKINEVGFSFYERIPIEERKLYTISYDFHLINERNKPVLVNHKLTPIFLNEKGKIWKAMCLVALSSNQTEGNIIISKQGSEDFWKFNLDTNVWEKEQKVKLSEREFNILELSARGFTINEIAEKIFVSSDTVKFHRRKIFDKFNVQSISEALSYAKINKLI